MTEFHSSFKISMPIYADQQIQAYGVKKKYTLTHMLIRILPVDLMSLISDMSLLLIHRIWKCRPEAPRIATSISAIFVLSPMSMKLRTARG
jgi:hypothetical protein